MKIADHPEFNQTWEQIQGELNLLLKLSYVPLEEKYAALKYVLKIAAIKHLLGVLSDMSGLKEPKT